MKTLRFLLVAGLLQLGLLSTATAQSDLAAIKSAGVLRIGTEGTYAPFSFHDKGRGLTGFDVELGRAIAERLGVKAQFVEGKWDGLIAGLDVKRYDAVINQVNITAERQAKYAFSEPYIASPAVLIVRNENDKIRSFADLKGARSANVLGSNFGTLAARHGADVVTVQAFNDSIELLVSRRVDATVNDYLSFLDFKKQRPQAPVKVVARDQSSEFGSSGVLLRKGDPELLKAVNDALAQIKADGTYKRISETFFGVDLLTQ